MTQKEIKILRSPIFKISLPYRWRELSKDTQATTSIIDGPIDLPDISVAFYKGMCEAKTKDGEIALNKLYKLIKKNSISIRIEPGIFVYIDNRFTLHSRDSFNPTFIGEMPLRWIQRTFIAENLWNHRILKKSGNRIFNIQSEINKNECFSI